jgi:predicted O-linked N-acetylglucosamine transferase (SPINDLY family)
MPNNALRLCVQYLQDGDLERAEQTVRQLLQAQPDDAQALCLLGVVRQARGSLEEALALFKESARRNAQSAAPYDHMGALFLQARQPDQAIACLKESLRRQPLSPETCNNLGNAYLLAKKKPEALACFREAVRLRPDFVEALNNLAMSLMSRRELDEAQAILERALKVSPRSVATLICLAMLHIEKGELDQAQTVAGQVLQLDARLPTVQNLAGKVLLKRGRYEEAVRHFQTAVQAAPTFAPAMENLGVALLRLERINDAIACLTRAGQLEPGNVRIAANLAFAFTRLGRWEQALQAASAALKLQPDCAEAHNSSGLAYLNLGRTEQAVVAFERALEARPDFPEALSNLGWAYGLTGQLERAAKTMERAIQLRPDFPDALTNLGLTYNRLGRCDESRATLERSLHLRPDTPETLSGLGSVYLEIGRVDEAIACYRNCLALRPRDEGTYSNMLFALHYSANWTAEDIFREHLAWGRRQVAAPLAARSYPNPRDAERRLRVGYVSGDFRTHVMGRYLEPVLEVHDRARFEVYCYANVGRPDDMTQRFRQLAEHWRDIHNLSDDEVENLIRQDRIDLLIDLSGHTGGNRLTVFARKPAPVQATHFGYQFSSGLPTIDFQITDAVCDPPGLTECYHTEQLVRLPEIHWCYRPSVSVQVNPLPAVSSGHVTFGTFNAVKKITAPAIAAWARILDRLPNSRLLVRAQVSSESDRRLRDAFAANGVEPARVLLVGKRSRPEYFRLYHEVDLSLDPFPYTGCNTTCDSLWMGVPVVTLAGRTAVARQGASPLAHLGLHDLIADTPAAYVESAVRLAEDVPRLLELRATLRERMTRSTLMSPERFTRQLEEAYRWMWRQWCRRNESR